MTRQQRERYLAAGPLCRQCHYFETTHYPSSWLGPEEWEVECLHPLEAVSERIFVDSDMAPLQDNREWCLCGHSEVMHRDGICAGVEHIEDLSKDQFGNWLWLREVACSCNQFESVGLTDCWGFRPSKVGV